MSDQPNAPHMVKICELWQRRSAKGATYFSGYAGDVQWLLFDGGRKPHPTRPDEEIHVWRCWSRNATPTAGRRDVTPSADNRPGIAHAKLYRHRDRRSRVSRLASAKQRQAHVDRLAAEFDAAPEDEIPF
jgi:hypothetical protein